MTNRVGHHPRPPPLRQEQVRPPQHRDAPRSGGTPPPPRDVFVDGVGAPPASRRERALEHMMRYVPPTDTALRGAIARASSSFSDRQILRMDQAGVVFAANRPGSLPAERVRGAADAFVARRSETIGGRTGGRYLPELRTIQMRSRAEGAIVHEMAHAWDDVRNDRHRLGDGADRRLQRRLALEDEAGALAQRGDALHRRPPPGSLAFDSDRRLRDPLEEYRGQRPNPNDDTGRSAFALHADRHEPLENTRELYAEGYALFHRGTPEGIEVMRRQAPQLYRELYREARREHTLGSQPPPN